MNLVNTWLPWILEAIYCLMALSNLWKFDGQFFYWFGASVLNAGVIMMMKGM